MMLLVNRNDAQFIGMIDRVLEGVCKRLQLSNTQFQLAKEHYEAVGRWLEAPESAIAKYRPKIYPQGSLPMGVTNKPVFKDEYDLDFICELMIPPEYIYPTELMSWVEQRICENRDYKSRVSRGNRCITLHYAHDFHLDIVPACAQADIGFGQVKIPDREKQNWKDTNSKEYVQWFNDIANAKITRFAIDHAEPLTPQESLEEKAALKCAVQLIKRFRDVAFQDQDDLAPASILLTTLSAQAFQKIRFSQQQSTFEIVSLILDDINAKIANTPGQRLVVWNPVNLVQEDLGERWANNPPAYYAFVQWISDFSMKWKKVRECRGRELALLLGQMFGEQPIKESIEEDTLRYSENNIWIQSGNGRLSSVETAIRAPRHTFYGQ